MQFKLDFLQPLFSRSPFPEGIMSMSFCILPGAMVALFHLASLTAIDLKNKWRETRMPRQTPFPLCWLVTHGDIFAGQFHVLPVWAGSWTHRNVWMRFSGLCDTGAEALKPLTLSWSLFLGQNHYWQLMDDKGIDQISTELSIRRKSWSCLGNWCAMNVIWT